MDRQLTLAKAMQMTSVLLLLLACPLASGMIITEADRSCGTQDLQHRMQVQQKLKGVCEDMCKEVGASLSCALRSH